MQPGNLVKITRASIGVPEGTIGLILKVYSGGQLPGCVTDVLICNAQQRTVRRLVRDLEIVNASR